MFGNMFSFAKVKHVELAIFERKTFFKKIITLVPLFDPSSHLVVCGGGL